MRFISEWIEQFHELRFQKPDEWGKNLRPCADPLAVSEMPYAVDEAILQARTAVEIAELETEKAKAIVKALKEAKIKVQAAIQADQVRVSAASKDDLQEAIRVLREHDFGVALQFGNSLLDVSQLGFRCALDLGDVVGDDDLGGVVDRVVGVAGGRCADATPRARGGWRDPPSLGGLRQIPRSINGRGCQSSSLYIVFFS